MTPEQIKAYERLLRQGEKYVKTGRLASFFEEPSAEKPTEGESA